MFPDEFIGIGAVAARASSDLVTIIGPNRQAGLPGAALAPSNCMEKTKLKLVKTAAGAGLSLPGADKGLAVSTTESYRARLVKRMLSGEINFGRMISRQILGRFESAGLSQKRNCIQGTVLR